MTAAKGIVTRQEVVDRVCGDLEWCFRGEQAQFDVTREDLTAVRERVRDVLDELEQECADQFAEQEAGELP